MYKIGTVIDARPDGSYVYMSSKGILNLDDWKELKAAEEEDKSFLSLPQLGPSARDCASTRLPHIHKYSKYRMEDVIVSTCRDCGHIDIEPYC